MGFSQSQWQNAATYFLMAFLSALCALCVLCGKAFAAVYGERISSIFITS